MKKVLILCTGNSCRSQMAEVMWQNLSDQILGGGQWQSESAGSKPSGYVHPLALKCIEELGLSGDGLVSKSVDPFMEQEIDLAVTVCDNAKEACPVLPGVKETLHWPFEDPADATGTEAEQMETFRRIRDEIKTRISEFLKASKSNDQPA
ncbi:MAG: arsenate reductase ArsC [Mariniblastus sp.]